MQYKVAPNLDLHSRDIASAAGSKILGITLSHCTMIDSDDHPLVNYMGSYVRNTKKIVFSPSHPAGLWRGETEILWRLYFILYRTKAKPLRISQQKIEKEIHKKSRRTAQFQRS